MKLGDVCVAIMLCLALFALSGCGKQDEVEKRAPAQVEVTEEPSSSDSEEEHKRSKKNQSRKEFRTLGFSWICRERIFHRLTTR